MERLNSSDFNELKKNGIIKNSDLYSSLNEIENFDIARLYQLLAENKNSNKYITSHYVGHTDDRSWMRSDSYKDIKERLENWPNITGEEVLGYDTNTNQVGYDDYESDYYVYSLVNDTLSYVARTINARFNVLSLIDKYCSKANANNCHITDEQMAMMQKILAKALELELNEAIEAFNAGKMSKIKFDIYVNKYKVAKEKLSHMAKNWEAQKEQREQLQQKIEIAKEKAKIAAKRKEVRALKRKAEKELRLARKAELKVLKAQRKAERKAEKAAKKQQDKKDHISKMLNRNEEETK